MTETDALQTELDALDRQDVARKERGHLSPKERARVRQAVRDHRQRKADAAEQTFKERDMPTIWSENLAKLSESERGALLAAQDRLAEIASEMLDVIRSIRDGNPLCYVALVYRDARQLVADTGLSFVGQLPQNELHDLQRQRPEDVKPLAYFRQDHPSYVEYGIVSKLSKAFWQEFVELCASYFLNPSPCSLDGCTLLDIDPEISAACIAEYQNAGKSLAPVIDRPFAGTVDEVEKTDSGNEQKAAEALAKEIEKTQRALFYLDLNLAAAEIEKLNGGVNGTVGRK